MKQITMPMDEYEDELLKLQEDAYNAGYEAGQDAISKLVLNYSELTTSDNIKFTNLTQIEKNLVQYLYRRSGM